MFLKSLTMRGFKSFASATTLILEPGITCVVGPNGSGKSNVVDALAWVMGEQGAKNLRGGKMDDVIFAGTANRQALGRAEVSLTIDNTDGAIPIDYTEVTISRTLFRTGGSEYAVNGTPARLLDIQELLNDSGLGKEMHVIVGQGRLDQILHADPLERRGFIEEAAGVLKHRRRKDKALRKLTGLQTNLDRLLDLRQELSRQLGPLGRQAKAAKRAAGVQATLRDTSARLLADDIVQIEAQLSADPQAVDQSERRAEIEAQLRHTDVAIEAGQAELTEFETTVEHLSTLVRSAGAQAARARAFAQRAGDRVSFLRSQPLSTTGKDSPEGLLARAERFAAELTDATTDREAREAALAELSTGRDTAQQQLREHEEELSRERARIAAAVRRRAQLASSREVAAKAYDTAQRTLDALGQRETQLDAEISAARQELETTQRAAAAREEGETELDAAHEEALTSARAAHEQLTAIDDEAAALRTESGRLNARIEALELSTRVAADTAELLAAGVSGTHAPLGDLIAIAPGFEVAVAAVLGELAAAIIVDDVDAATALLAAVGEDKDVDLLVAHLQSAQTDSAEPPAAEAPTGNTSVPASEVVRVRQPALQRLLGAQLDSVEICADGPAARAALQERPEMTFASLTGEVYSAQRVRRAGSSEGARIAARTALDEARTQQEKTRAALAALDERRPQAAEAARGADAGVEQALQALHESDAAIMAAGQDVARAAQTLERLEDEATGIESRRAQAAAEAESAQQALRSAEEQLAAEGRAVSADSSSADSDSAEGAEEPDTSARDAVAQRITELNEQVMEARIGLRSVQDRERFLGDRVSSLRRQATEEEAARKRAQAAHEERARKASGVEAMAQIAAELGEHLGGLEEQSDNELGRSRQTRREREEHLAAQRRERAERAETLAQLTNAEHEAQLARERFVIQLEELQRRAEAETGLSAEHLVEQYGPHLPVPVAGDGEEVDELPYVRAEVEKRRDQAAKDLKAIGKVNPLALEEYAALQERHDFLEKQINDIEDGRRDLMGLVKEVDKHVEEVFTAAFADTQREFQHIFSRLFPGGEGALTLTDPDDMLETGVEVHARPAGKKVKRLSLLSGGERSLVAVAMLVAIFKARPSPFYVMDEVEAALDDLNLSRLLTVFRELQETSQLIVITHQKRTMEIADALYGVTMGGDGISKVISQRLHHRGEVDDTEA